MAIITPLVLMLILAIIDLSIAVYSYVNIAEAARAGARYAAVHGASATVKCGPTSNDAKVESLVRSYNAGLVSSRLTVNSTWPQGNNSPGSRVTVSINYEYPLVTTWFLGRASIKLSASQSMIIIH